MTETLRFVEAFIARDASVVRYDGDDGYPVARHFDVVVAKAADGRELMLPNGRRGFNDEDGYYFAERTYDADQMLVRVQARGTITVALWVELEPQPSLEERLGPYGIEWQLEQRDRADWGGGCSLL